MTRRALAHAVSLAFVLATGVQSMLHAHVSGDRHHDEGCAGALFELRHPHAPAPHAAKLAGVPAGGQADPVLPHANCARCVTPSGDLRVSTAALVAPRASVAVRSDARAASPAGGSHVSHPLRGPPSGVVSA